MDRNVKLLKYACYSANVSMALIANISPIFFLTFRELYGISFSMLGVLIVINYGTQLGIDLVFSFYSHKFNMEKTVKLIPVITALGLLIYGVYPYIFPNSVYVGLVIGTLIFSAAGGLGEVLISPVIAALPSKNPERDMSALHSVFAWGVVGVVIITTGLLFLFGKEYWQIISLLWMILPIVGCILFSVSKIPPLQTPKRASKVFSLLKNKAFLVFFFCIFFGGAAECIMSQWSSSYLEYSLGIPKIQGDILGVATFGVMLGLGRTLFAKYGKNLIKTLLISSWCAVICYITASLSPLPFLGLAACALCGFATAMLWPGSLSVCADAFPSSGVAVFALMAAGGDLGASLGNQVMGVITDFTANNGFFISVAEKLSVSPDKFSMKIGILCGTVFPLVAAILYTFLHKKQKKESV